MPTTSHPTQPASADPASTQATGMTRAAALQLARDRAFETVLDSTDPCRAFLLGVDTPEPSWDVLPVDEDDEHDGEPAFRTFAIRALRRSVRTQSTALDVWCVVESSGEDGVLAVWLTPDTMIAGF